MEVNVGIHVVEIWPQTVLTGYPWPESTSLGGGGQTRLAFEVLCWMELTRLHLQIFQGWGTAVSNKGFVVFLLQKANQSLSFDSPQARHSLKPLSFPCYLFMMGPVLKEVIQKLWLGEQVALKKPLNSQIMEKHVFWIGKCPWFPERGLWAWHSVRGGGLLCHLQIFI